MCEPEPEEDWEIFSAHIINDIKDHVKLVEVCKSFPSDNHRQYFNLTTLEGNDFTIEVSVAGYKIIGQTHESNSSDDEGDVFETHYGLLNTISEEFRNSFGNALIDKLKGLQ